MGIGSIAMQFSRNTLLIVSCLGLLWGCPRAEPERPADLTEEVAEVLPDQPVDPQIVTAAPTMASTVFANKWAGVARVTLAPGELIPPHDAGFRLVDPLTPCTLSVVDKDVEEVIHAVPGELITLPAGRLSLANVSENESASEFLMIERSPVETSPDLETLPIPDAAIDMERHGTVLLDDDKVLATDISLDELAEEPLPSNLPLLVFAYTTCDVEFQGAAVGDADHVVDAGSAFWQPAGYGVVTNVGESEAHILVVGFRR
jgi:hypothetical protein